jgi:hypothetical protein
LNCFLRYFDLDCLLDSTENQAIFGFVYIRDDVSITGELPTEQTKREG